MKHPVEKRLDAIRAFVQKGETGLKDHRHSNYIKLSDKQKSGMIAFKNLGILYLIAIFDDHSRFVPAGKWFKTQGKMNVFQIWYESLSKPIV